MTITVKIGNHNQAKKLTAALREKLGWTNPTTICCTNLQSTVTVDIAPDFCSIPHVLNTIAEYCSDLRIGV